MKSNRQKWRLPGYFVNIDLQLPEVVHTWLNIGSTIGFVIVNIDFQSPDVELPGLVDSFDRHQVPRHDFWLNIVTAAEVVIACLLIVNLSTLTLTATFVYMCFVT